MRYCLRRDEDGHWYLVPVDKLAAFAAFRDDEEGGMDIPEGCQMVQIWNLSFTDPKEN